MTARVRPRRIPLRVFATFRTAVPIVESVRALWTLSTTCHNVQKAVLHFTCPCEYLCGFIAHRKFDSNLRPKRVQR